MSFWLQCCSSYEGRAQLPLLRCDSSLGADRRTSLHSSPADWADQTRLFSADVQWIINQGRIFGPLHWINYREFCSVEPRLHRWNPTVWRNVCLDKVCECVYLILHLTVWRVKYSKCKAGVPRAFLTGGPNWDLMVGRRQKGSSFCIVKLQISTRRPQLSFMDWLLV